MPCLSAQQLYFIRATTGSYGYSKPSEIPPVQVIEYQPAQEQALRVCMDYTDVIYRDYNELESVVYYPQFDVFCFQQTDGKTYGLYTSRVDSLKELVVKRPENYRISSFLPMRIVDNHWAYCCGNMNAREKFVFVGMDFSLSNYFNMSASDFGDLHLTGVVSQRVGIKPNDGHMYLAIVSGIENRPPFSVVLPEKYWIDEKYTAVLVNDDQKTVVLIRRVRPAKGEDYGRLYAALYDKENDAWSDMELKGSSPVLMTYGRWLAGAVQDSRTYDKISPGKAERDSVYMYVENSFNEKSQSFYRPGILFLFDTETGKYLEWETQQGDSEILLVDNDDVYYRVLNAIYKAPIINGERLGNAELLVQNRDVVPFIGWAFLKKE